MGINSQDVDDNVTIQDGLGTGNKAGVDSQHRLLVNGEGEADSGFAGRDAFQRWRVSNPTTLFDAQSQYNRSLRYYYEKTVTGGALSHNANESTVSMTITSSNGSRAVRQSKQYIRYQPGKSQLILVTFDFGSSTQANTQKMAGYFDDDNGIFIKNAGGSVSMVRRSKVTGSVVESDIAQASWNIDAMDGNGPSGITLDITKAQIFVADIEWLGVGTIRVGLVINGIVYYVHRFNHANLSSATYMTTANLPVRWEIKATAANSSSDSMKSVCASVQSEGGFSERTGLPFAYGMDTAKSISSTFEPVLSIRPKATFNSIVNRGQVVQLGFEVFGRSSDLIWRVNFDCSLTGASFSSVDDDSIIEYDESATSCTNGVIIAKGYVGVGGTGSSSSVSFTKSLLSKIPISLDIDGANPTNITIEVRTRTGNADCLVAYNWVELY